MCTTDKMHITKICCARCNHNCKKLSCRREATRCFVSFKSLKGRSQWHSCIRHVLSTY